MSPLPSPAEGLPTSNLPVLVISRRALIGSLLAAALIGGLVASLATAAVVGLRTAPATRDSSVRTAFPGSPTPAPSPTSPAAAPTATNSAPPGPTATLPALTTSAPSTSAPTDSSASTAPGGSAVAPAAASSGAASPSDQPAGSDPFAIVVEIAHRNAPAVVTITTESSDGFGGSVEGVGSGMIVDPAGWILTNAHVVAGSSSISVALKDGRTLPARVVASNTSQDLAMIKMTGTSFPTVSLGSSGALQPGQLVIAIGSPLGDFPDSVTSGILSAVGRAVDIGSRRQPLHLTHMLQLDAPINPGNSGGPLFDAAGKVIGMITAVDPNGQGIAFAIPIDDARLIVQKSIQG